MNTIVYLYKTQKYSFLAIKKEPFGSLVILVL